MAYELDRNKRALVEAMLRKKGIEYSRAGTIPARPAGTAAPLSFAQQRLWFIEQLENAGALYNIPAAFRLRGPLDTTALEDALRETVKRHETLRTVFPSVNGEAVPVLLPEVDIEWSRDDLRGAGDRETLAMELAREDARLPFDLANGPLLRARLIRLDEADHIVALTIHHIAADGWSMKVLARELSGFSNVEPLPVQYGDFAAWQREWLTGPVLEKHLAYWKAALEGAPGFLEIPTDRPRPETQQWTGDRHTFRIPAATVQALKALAARHDATLFMVLLAAWQTLLFRYTGKTDIVTGSPVANRNLPEIEGLIGFFVNMLALRGRLRPEGSFAELLGETRNTTLAAYEHQALPFERLVDELKIPRNLSRTPLFQSVVVLQNASEGLSKLAGREVEVVPVDTGVAKFDLTLDVTEDAQGATAAIEYRTGLFDTDRIERMACHYLNLLEAVVADPGARLCDLPMLTPCEWALATRRDTRTFPLEYPGIHRQFEAQAARTPEAPAVTFEGRSLTYAELDGRANAVARRLKELGAGPEVRVGMCLERSLEMIVGIVAILKTGAAYVPIDPTCPKDRVDYILADSQAPILVVDRSRLELGVEAAMLCIDDISGTDAAFGSLEVSPDTAAYVIYTSGSTGRPKGVVVDHRNVLRLMSATRDWFHFDESDVWTLFHSYAFDFSVWEIWGALFYGGRLVVVPYWVARAPEAFYKLLCEESVTVLNQTPSAFRQLMRTEEEAGVNPALALRYVVFGGEALELQSLRQWYQSHPKSPRLVNMYGITETTVHVTYRALSPADLDCAGKSFIGVGIPDLPVYLLDAFLQPVPVGVPGEIFVGGAGVARGYLFRPELTATRFIPDPFGATPGARLYRSGDLARMLPGGELEYLGRIDHQVKIRGFRIETGEIEAVLNQHPALAGSAVIARTDQPGEPRLTAYVVAKSGTAPSTSDLRAHLKQQLPDYMVPAAFVFLAALPLTGNGKVDRRALPAPEAGNAADDASHTAPRTPTEESLAAVWSQVLSIPRVSVHDNFFELGGDSILSIQAVSRANQAGVRVTTRDLFQHQTIASLAALADSKRESLRKVLAVEPGPVPLTPIQRWFFEQNLAHPNHWNQAVLLELQRPIGTGVLQNALNAVVQNHDAFRLRFHRENGEWRQIDAGSAATVELESGPVLEDTAAKLHASLDLARGPLIRAAYFEDSARLLIVAHHLIVDGVSWRVLVEDLEIACAQLLAGQPVALPANTCAFQAWARQLPVYAESAAIRPELGYWRQQTAEVFENRDTEADALTCSIELTGPQTQSLLLEVPKAYRTQINDVLLAALSTAYGNDVPVDLEGHGREAIFEDIDASRCVGWFTSIYPVHLPKPTRPAETLKAVKETLRQVPRNGIGYGIGRYLSPEPLPAAHAKISFNYLGRFDEAPDAARLFRVVPGEWGPAHHPDALRRHEIDITAWIAGGRLRAGFRHPARQAAFVEELAKRYQSALIEIIEHCKNPEAGGFTPSDFPKARVSQKSLDKLMSKLAPGTKR